MNSELLTFEENRIVTELKDTLKRSMGDHIYRIVLFGSKARGDHDEDSDIDLAIIVKGLTGKMRNHILETVADLELKYLIPLSTLVMSEEGFEKLKKRERRIALDIENEGILV